MEPLLINNNLGNSTFGNVSHNTSSMGYVAIPDSKQIKSQRDIAAYKQNRRRAVSTMMGTHHESTNPKYNTSQTQIVQRAKEDRAMSTMDKRK